MKKCLNCGAEMEKDALFCHECGAKLEIEEVEVKLEEQSVEEKFCVHCGRAIEPDSMFCPYCGKPQEEEETKSEEPQQKAEKLEPEQVKPQKEKPNVKEEPKVEESPKVETQAEGEPVYEMEEKKKSKSWLWILLGVILLGIIGVGYYLLTQTDDTPKTEENEVTVVTSQEEATFPNDPKEFLNSLYNDFYEQGNANRFDEAVLSKYFTKGAMRKFYVEDNYEEGRYFYCTDFLTHGTISGGPDPDYGDKVVYRLIETENDGWFKVTNIWDVIKDPVIVYLQVKTIDGALRIVDVKAKNLDQSEMDESADLSTEFVISIEKLRNKSFKDFDKLFPLQGFSKIFVPSKREGYGTDVWYKNCEVDKNGVIKTKGTKSCYVEVFDGMNASIRITVFEKDLYEQIKSEVLKYAVNKDNRYHFRWSDDYTSDLTIDMGLGNYIEGGYFIEIPDH